MKLRPILPKRKGASPHDPAISINGSGLLTINPSAVEHYKIDSNHHIAILQDEEKPDDFYLLPTFDKNFPKLKKAGKSSYCTFYISARETLQSHFNLGEGSIKIWLAGMIKTEMGTAICMKTDQLRSHTPTPA